MDDIRKEVESNHKQKSILTTKSANDWLEDASTKPPPVSLFENIWVENELCFLYGGTGLGKTILAVQIASEISKTKKVLYLDFELSDRQFYGRYSNGCKDRHRFPDNFMRSELNPDEADYQQAGYNTAEDFIAASIENAIIKTGSSILVVDNITYIKTEMEKARDAAPLMKSLRAMKEKYGLSILCLGHTPKRDLTKPLTINDLMGSSTLMSFSDAAFAVGQSAKDKSLRYLKHTKARSTEIVYDAENILLFEITKDNNFLMFTSVQDVHTRHEHEHLQHRSSEDWDQIKQRVQEMSDKGLSQRDISKELGIGLGTVNKYLKERSCSPEDSMSTVSSLNEQEQRELLERAWTEWI